MLLDSTQAARYSANIEFAGRELANQGKNEFRWHRPTFDEA